MDSRPLVELVEMTDRLRSAFRHGPRQLGLARGIEVAHLCALGDNSSNAINSTVLYAGAKATKPLWG
jgi:hypothetical protein